MSLKYKALISAAALILAFGVGRYSAQSTVPTVKTVETIKTDSETRVDKDLHKVTVITKDPEGVETTTITEDTVTKADHTQDQVTHLDQTVTPPKLAPLNLSVMAGVDPLNSFKPLYGLSITKQVLGPITVGAWGLTNSTFGLSVGINF